ncbi:uncharacterized protein LOC116771578 isoform X1 [Danaus plexippus]|uniref:uncharacterized protein LOC116771578 isoform X1 n=1 Tax=Danaus plexippus TaxID=13037 RepID=UPI002AAF3FB0|nr:uncharacterized protein LOC116771578 isoform X1 [Danaus plexippus]
MLTNRIGCLVFVCLMLSCDALKNNKFKRKVDIRTNNLVNKTSDSKNLTENGRGFLYPAGLFSLGKVLNFFPVGDERECKPSTFTIAGAGICLNPYDCRQRDGKASGDCAHGLGVCCVFEVSCGATVQNNLTYFMSPRFPELWSGDENCTIHIERTHAGIMQLRIDFLHFTIGQPNRTTGACDEDVMVLGEGDSNFTLCGQNHGQHVYYNLPSTVESREAGELPNIKSTPLVIRMRGSDMPRIWLMRLAQMPLAHSSPHNCLQYHIDNNGTIKTFNFASNGRHLASQEYRACVRRNLGFCSVRYTPCDSRSFRIGPDPNPGAASNLGSDPAAGSTEPTMPVNDSEEEEGSGAEPQIIDSSSTRPGIVSRIWGYIWGSSQRSWRWSPYLQHQDVLHYYGYGPAGFGRRRCTDRITIPCENEYFLPSPSWSMGVCDPHRCGSSLCAGSSGSDCLVESSVTPFAVSVHFGPPTPKQNPDLNLGACLRYQQLPCET